MFTNENTEGFDECEIEELNVALVNAMQKYDTEFYDSDYYENEQYESEKILKNFDHE